MPLGYIHTRLVYLPLLLRVPTYRSSKQCPGFLYCRDARFRYFLVNHRAFHKILKGEGYLFRGILTKLNYIFILKLYLLLLYTH